MAPSSPALSSGNKGKEPRLIDMLLGFCHLICTILFEKFYSRHLKNPMPLPTLSGSTCIVTGATSGIGLETARQLAEAGAHVVMAVRNTNAAHELIHRWQNSQSNMRHLDIDVMELDLLSFKSVIQFCEAWNSSSKPLHILINNAGILSVKPTQEFSRDGYEKQLQVNHLAPALLSLLLFPSLRRAAPSRIVNVNSLSHRFGLIDLNASANRINGYQNTKLANLMFSSALQKHLLVNTNIDVLCADPGVSRTNITRDAPTYIQVMCRLLPCLLNAQEGSRSSLYAATDTDIIKYCRKLKDDESPVCAYIGYDCRLIDPCKHAHDVGTSEFVWEKTLEMIGVPSDVVDILLQGKNVHCRYET